MDACLAHRGCGFDLPKHKNGEWWLPGGEGRRIRSSTLSLATSEVRGQSELEILFQKKKKERKKEFSKNFEGMIHGLSLPMVILFKCKPCKPCVDAVMWG